ncbi:MAG: hypothetical protein J0H42_04130 [Rhizobiales bacterium]|nr:hypothetical protein [Hyphomicrobiales bacterium]
MMGDWFWDIATSVPVLGGIGLLLGAALIVGYFPLVKWVPGIGQYVQAGRLVAILAAGALFFLIGFRTSDERAEAKSLRAQLAARQVDIDAANDVASKADAARAELARQNEQDQQRIEEYEERLKRRPPGNGNCGCTLVPDDFDRVPDHRRGAHKP